jgi:hypothetical protein
MASSVFPGNYWTYETRRCCGFGKTVSGDDFEREDGRTGAPLSKAAAEA